MFEELFRSSGWMSFPVVSMLLFMVVFGGVLVWVFARKRRPHYERMARLPLGDDRNGVADGGGRVVDAEESER